MSSENRATSGTALAVLVGLWSLDRVLSTPMGGWPPPLVTAAAVVFLGDRLLSERALRPTPAPHGRAS